MPTTEKKPMNAFAKLAAVRREFLSAGAKKTGKNPHAEFMYFELEDIVLVAEPLFDKYGLLMQTSFTADTAMCQLVNVEIRKTPFIFHSVDVYRRASEISYERGAGCGCCGDLLPPILVYACP